VESRSIFNPNAFTDAVKSLAVYQAMQHSVTHVQGTNPVIQVVMQKTEQGFCGQRQGKNLVSFLNMRVSFRVRLPEEVGYVGEEPWPEDYWKIED